MREQVKRKWIFVLAFLFVAAAALAAFSIRNARADTEIAITRDSLPDEVTEADYSAEFGAQEERGWTYSYKLKDTEWTLFTDAEYSAADKKYAHGAVELGHLSAVPTGGASVKRTYTPDRDGVTRFMAVLHAYNSDGHGVQDNVNYDGQIFYAEIAGRRQNLQFVKIGTAADNEALAALLASCDKQAGDYTESQSVRITNEDKGVYLVFADFYTQKDVPVDFILDADGDEDGFAGEWCDGAGLRIKSFVSYYKETGGKVLSNGDVLDETTMPGDFGPIGYFTNPTWDGTEFGMPVPNPYLAQFSAEQGTGGWYYKMHDPELGLIDMVYDAASGKYLAPADNPGASADALYISRNASVANYARPVVKAYKAEKSGIIRFVGQVQNGYFQSVTGDGFDGQKFYVKNNAGEKIPFVYGISAQPTDDSAIESPSSVTYAAAPDDELFLPPDDRGNVKFDAVYNVIVETKVEKGEFVYFYGDAVGQPWCDMMRMGIVPIYTYVDPADAIGAEEFTPDTVFGDLYDQAFGNEQNTNGWYYLYGNAQGDYYRAVSDGGVWSSGFGTANTLKSMTPAAGFDAIRAWRAENGGKVRVLGLASKAENAGAVTLEILHKGASESRTLYSHTFGASETEQRQIMLGDLGERDTYITVAAGDILFFSVKAESANALNVRFYVAYTERDGETSAAGIGDKIPPYTVETVLESQYAQSYATVQGNAGWYKFFGSADEYYKMRYDGFKWSTGYEGTVEGNVFTPSKKYASINAYRAPSTGELRVLGTVQKLAAGGDGVKVIVTHLKNDKIVCETLSLDENDLERKELDLSLSVQAGEFVFFSVVANKSVVNDAVTMKLFAYYLSVTETPVLDDELGDSAPPVKTVDEYTVDDITDAMFTEYMTANFDEQGKNGWYYLYGKGDDYYEMKKDGNSWRGPSNDPYNIVEGPRGTAPGMIWDTIRAYQVPNDGYMRVFAHFNFWQGYGGDGVKIVIKNITSGQVVYNEILQGGPEWKAIHTFASDEFKVSRGDVLFFSVDKYGESNSYDNVTMGLYPLYSIKTSDEIDYPAGGIGAKAFDDGAVPPKIEEGGGSSGSHIVSIPLPDDGKTEAGCAGVTAASGAIVSLAALAAAAIFLNRKRKA